MDPAVILVVDDDPTRLKLVSRLLSQAGHHVLEASSGQQGLSLAHEQPPDLLLVDEVLPDMSGTSICQKVKADARLAHIPAAVFSAHRRSGETVAASLDAGADEYITWPLDHREFIARINTLLRLKRTEDQLREQEAFYRQLYQTMTSGVAVYEVQGDGERVIFKDINRAGERISQVRREDILGRDMREVFPSVVDMGFFDMLVRVGRTGEPEHLPSVPYQDRRIAQWVENYVYRLPNGNVVAVFDDTTDKIHAEMALGESEGLLRAVFDTDPSCIFVKDEEGRYVLVNRAIAELYGCQPEDMIGKTDADMSRVNRLAPNDAASFLHDDLIVVQEGKPRFIPLEPFTLPDGTVRWFQTTKVPLSHGSMNRFMLGVAVDVTDRKLAEETLQESERRYRTLFQTMAQGVFYQEADGTLFDVNDAALEMFGLTRDEFLGRTSMHPEWQVVNEDGTPLPGSEHPSMVALTSGKPVRNRVIRVFNPVRQDWVWVNANATPEFRPGEDSPYRVFLTMHDITQRKKAEEALSRSEENFSLVFRTSPNAMIITNARDGKFIEVNEAFTSHTGFTREEVIADSAIGLNLWVDMEDCQQMQSALREGKPVTGKEVLFRKKNNGIATCLFSAQIIQLGGEACILSSINDITERKQAEEALRASEERYRLLAENATDVIWTMDLTGRFTYLSPSVEKLRGYTPDEVTGQTMAEVLTPESLLLASSSLQRTIEAAQAGQPIDPQPTLELEQPRKDGSTVWTEVVASLTFDREGNIIGVQGVSRDISERKRLEAQVMEAQRMEAVGQLAAGIAHDFNNLLTGINGFAELLQMELTADDPRRHMADVILQSGTRAAHLVRQLLGFARKQTVRPQVINVNETLLSLSESMRQALGPAIEVQTALLPNLWPTMFDPTQGEQIFRDLIDNARRAMPEGGKLTIETHNLSLSQSNSGDSSEARPGDYVAVAFHDTGPVLPSEHQSRIFEPFFFTSREVADGTGLRLAAVYGIVRQNGGHIHVMSREGEGTRLEIRLPRHLTQD